jgi:hypothetical protein
MSDYKKDFILHLVNRVPDQVASKLVDKGCPKSMLKDKPSISRAALSYVNRKEEEAAIELAKIHPDRDLILKAAEAEAAIAKMPSDDSNCAGCGSIAAAALLAEGDATKPAKTSVTINPNVVIAGGAIVLIVAIISSVYLSK